MVAMNKCDHARSDDEDKKYYCFMNDRVIENRNAINAMKNAMIRAMVCYEPQRDREIRAI